MVGVSSKITPRARCRRSVPLPTEPSSVAVVAPTLASVHSPLALVLPVTPAMAMRSPSFRPWLAPRVTTMGVALVAPVMVMPAAAEERCRGI
jgi:hypothetical protein